MRSLASAVIVMALVGCSDNTTSSDIETGPGDFENERLSISNNEDELGTRVTYTDEEVPVEGGSPKSAAAAAFSLRLIAEVSPPEHEGQVLQATSVDMQGNFAIVSYAMRGPSYLGGLDVFNITNTRRPVLQSSVVFEDSDVNSAAYFDGYVHMAQATGDPAFEYPSAFELLRLQGHNLILEDNRRVGLTSFAGTAIESTGARVYSTSGNTGGLTVTSTSSWQAEAFHELHDARWVDVAEGKVVVAQGTPGQLSVYDEATLSHISTYSFPGADVAESKTTVEVVGGKAFVAGGPAGLQVLSLDTGLVIGSIPIPDAAVLGLDPNVVVTNAAAVDGDLVFISNGEAGVYVAQADVEIASAPTAVPLNLVLLGQLQFDSLQSVNHVDFKKDYLMIATGLGGLKIVEVRR